MSTSTSASSISDESVDSELDDCDSSSFSLDYSNDDENESQDHTDFNCDQGPNQQPL